MEYVIVGILAHYRAAEEAVEDLEVAGIIGYQVEVISDIDEDARTAYTPGEKLTDPPSQKKNWLERLFGKGGALEKPEVRADSGGQPNYIGNQEYYATHVKEGGAIVIVRVKAEEVANRAAAILHDHGARTPGQKDGPVIRKVDSSPTKAF